MGINNTYIITIKKENQTKAVDYLLANCYINENQLHNPLDSKDNCYWMVAKSSNEIDQLLLIQGVANSSLMTKYHDLMFNNKLYSGRRRYFSQYVEKYPLPDILSPSSQKIISIVKKLNSPNTFNKENLIKELEITVAQAFDVDPIPLFR